MSVLIETSLGEMVIDLYTDDCPITCKNFLKLCKIKYYNHCLFHNVQKNFIVQSGDPTGTGKGGDSIFKFLYGDQARFFEDEIKPSLKHKKVGTVAMASAGKDLNASQFYITTREELDYLDEKHTVFGEIAEGIDCLMRINESFVDENNKPLKNIRIKHTYILDDPFLDPDELLLLIPENSPERKPEMEGGDVRLEDDWVAMDEGKDAEEVEKMLKEKESKSRAVVLEMIGDLPEADFTPPENVLFVCKLNPITEDEDLEIIFSRFGKVKNADIIRDAKSGDSLCYAFIEFDKKEDCEAAYLKMENVLIDDRRIHVDFSQSVGKLWSRFKKFGKKDKKVEEDEMNGSKQVKCFKCGRHGHISRNCKNEEEEEGRGRGKERVGRQRDGREEEEEEEEEEDEKDGKEKTFPKYELKSMDASFGNPTASYDYVFDRPIHEEEEEERKEEGGWRREHKVTKGEGEERKENFRDREKERKRDGGSERERIGGRGDRERGVGRERDGGRERGREGERNGGREKERERDGGRERRERESGYGDGEKEINGDRHRQRNRDENRERGIRVRDGEKERERNIERSRDGRVDRDGERERGRERKGEEWRGRKDDKDERKRERGNEVEREMEIKSKRGKERERDEETDKGERKERGRGREGEKERKDYLEGQRGREKDESYGGMKRERKYDDRRR